MDDQLWLRSRHYAIYHRLIASRESEQGNLAPGTQGMIGHAIDHFREKRDRKAQASLEAISVTVARLEIALRFGSLEDQVHIRREIQRLAEKWLFEAPMFPEPRQSAEPGAAVRLAA